MELFGVTLTPRNRWGGFKAIREKWQAHVDATLIRPVLRILSTRSIGDSGGAVVGVGLAESTTRSASASPFAVGRQRELEARRRRRRAVLNGERQLVVGVAA